MDICTIYASTSGNVELVCERVVELLRENHLAVSLHRAERTDISVVNEHKLFILATSTWEHGELNPFFKKLLKQMAETDLHRKTAAFIGLGDTRYEPVLFCQGIEIVKETFLRQGGDQISDTLKINGEPHHLLDTAVTEWTKRLIPHILESMREYHG